ncbi:MAG TPA: hypothetical protein VFZ38_21265, partial [Vicinamibacterales bacterium]
MKPFVWLFCGVLVAGTGLVAAPEDVRIIEVDGEGAKYWPRWRGPSGQGLVPQGQYVDKWSPKTSVWNVPVPGSGNSSPIVWGDRIFL